MLLMICLGCLALKGMASAEVESVEVRIEEPKAWIGQRVAFFVELRAPGSFAGSASFDLPELPGAVVMKIGSPVVGSEEIEGDTWFVQTHEFALFSQRPGTLEVPPFTVRFAHRDGFTGPSTDVRAETRGFKIEIQRPPGSEPSGFLITTETLDVTETWEPLPGPAEVGAVFKRTIVQSAPEVPGMALAPAPTIAPDGIRAYPGDAETKDKLERGNFLGERRETITYLLQKPGTAELPALTYVWWNPRTEELQSTTLPAVTFEITAAPTPAGSKESRRIVRGWGWLLASVVLVGLIFWQKPRLAGWAQQCHGTLNPPHRIAARQLLRACRKDDAGAAHHAWMIWRATQDREFEPDEDLRAEIFTLQRHQFGPDSPSPWCGDQLAHTFISQTKQRKTGRRSARPAALPTLNPGD